MVSSCRSGEAAIQHSLVCVGFEGGFGPKGLGNSAQALAWVALQ
jgi:hypothetical protein